MSTVMEEKSNNWIQMVRRDMSLTNIGRDLIWDRDKFRQLLLKIKEFHDEPEKKNENRTFSYERKKHRAEVMKIYWT